MLAATIIRTLKASMRGLPFGYTIAGLAVLKCSVVQAAVLTVGAGSGYDFATISAAVSAAQAHDTIRIVPGLYQDDFSTINVPLTIEGDGGIAVMEATVQIPNGKAIFVTNAAVTFRNMEFRNAKVADQNGAGIRGQSGDITVEDSVFRDNENGILVGNVANMNVTITNSRFAGNGFGDGFSHGIYVGRIASLIVRDSVFEGTRVGHDIKSRAASTTITGNTLDDGESGTTSYAIDASNGGVVDIAGNIIRQGPNTSNRVMVAYGAEGNAYLDGMLQISNNTFFNSRPGASIGVYNYTDVVAQLKNNSFDGVVTPLVGPGLITNDAPEAVPEPAGIGLLGLALIFLGLARRAVLA
jgi:hypothetical protein